MANLASSLIFITDPKQVIYTEFKAENIRST